VKRLATTILELCEQYWYIGIFVDNFLFLVTIKANWASAKQVIPISKVMQLMSKVAFCHHQECDFQ